MAYATFYPEVKISENDIIEYISEGDPEYIKKFIMKIISDKYDRTIDENCALLLLMEMTMKQAKDIYMNYQGMNISVSLYTIWREEIDNHRQSNNFKVLTSGSMEVGAPWLYAEKTDYLIKCSIPDYDENDVWFVRTVDNGWFSLNTVDTWMAGRLDISGSLFEYMNEMNKELSIL